MRVLGRIGGEHDFFNEGISHLPQIASVTASGRGSKGIFLPDVGVVKAVHVGESGERREVELASGERV